MKNGDTGQNIIIDGHRINIYKFDTPYSVLERYSSVVGASKSHINNPFILQLIPQFLRFTNTSVESFKTGTKYEIEDIRTVRDILLENFLKAVPHLSGNFPYLRPKDIIYIYLIEKGYSSLSIDDFGRVYNEFGDLLKRTTHSLPNYTLLPTEIRSFTNYRIIYISMGKYVSYVSTQSRKIQSKTKIEEKIFDQLSKVKPVELNEFVIEGTIEEISLNFNKETSLYSVFDMLSASFIMPFIVFSDGKNLMYKIYKHIRPIAEWLDIGHRSDQQSVIYFYVLDEPSHVSSTNEQHNTRNAYNMHNTHDIYRGGMWLENHIIRVDSRGAVTYVHDILEKLQKNNHFKIINETQYETRGKFSIANNSFNKAVFSDLITNDSVFSHLLYLDESSKSILEKKRFVYYHDSYHTYNSSSNTLEKGVSSNTLTLTMTDSITETGSHIDIRVSRASTETQIQQFMILFSYLFGMYLQKKDNVINTFSKLFKSVNFQKYERKVKIKNVDGKTGKRLKLLEQHNPGAFKHGGYSSKCQPKRRQPYLVPKSDIDKVKKEFKHAESKELAVELEKYGMLNWPEGSDDWYACYPREQNDDEKRHIWPGLIKQNEKASNYDKYPLLPCCFISNQFVKKGSKKYTDYTTTGAHTDQEVAEDVFDRPLSSNKATPKGRYAELPYYIQLLVEKSGYSQVEYRKKPFLPILRYGVIEGMDSIIHCMERAINEDYAKMSIDNKKLRVRDVLDRLSKKDDEWLVICRQEMYNYTYDEVRESLSDPNTYIDPDLYINILSKFYDCNIIIFKMDDNHPKGDISLPKFSKAYLSYKYNPKTETVVIVKVQSQRARVGTIRGIYQCELVVKYDKGKVEYMFNSKDKFIKTCFNITSKVSSIYITSPDDRYIIYDPQILL